MTHGVHGAESRNRTCDLCQGGKLPPESKLKVQENQAGKVTWTQNNEAQLTIEEACSAVLKAAQRRMVDCIRWLNLYQGPESAFTKGMYPAILY